MINMNPINITLSFTEIGRDENKITCELVYNGNRQKIYIPCDGQFHNSKWQSDGYIPYELERFIDRIVDRIER